MDEFHELYRKYAPQVFRFALFLCGDSSLAEDITSETFVRALTARGRIRNATVKSYLFTIARNIYRDWQRRNARYTQLPESMMDPGANPHSSMEEKSEMSDMLALLQQLPDVDRTALLLRAHENMPYDQIAETLGLSAVSVRVKVHRARLTLLRARLAAQEVLS